MTWRYQDEARSKSLWLDCLLYGQLAKKPEHPHIYLHTAGEAAYASAWAALDHWDIDQAHKSRLYHNLSETANFLQTLKPNRNRPGVSELRQRLQKIQGQSGRGTEVWAFLLGHWLQVQSNLPPIADYETVLELGWPLASFGRNYWTKGSVKYKKGDEYFRLVQPFPKVDAFALYGPFVQPEETLKSTAGERLVFGSLKQTKGLKAPPIWSMEAELGALPEVLLTRVGHVHRQFAGNDLPEWFEAVEVTYDPKGADLEAMLHQFWSKFSATGDLLFFTTEEQRQRCQAAWETFKQTLPEWAVPNDLTLHPCNWFEAAPPQKQKQALQKLALLERTFAKLDLSNSYLATKVNAIAAGCGTDEDVVLLTARYGLDAGLTLALRTIRYFVGSLEES